MIRSSKSAELRPELAGAKHEAPSAPRRARQLAHLTDRYHQWRRSPGGSASSHATRPVSARQSSSASLHFVRVERGRLALGAVWRPNRVLLPTSRPITLSGKHPLARGAFVRLSRSVWSSTRSALSRAVCPNPWSWPPSFRVYPLPTLAITKRWVGSERERHKSEDHARS